MTDSALAQLLRDKIISDPEVILGDQDLMRALVAASDSAMGANVVDLRGVAMSRLETRLDRLEDTHRSVIAAAYENLAGTNQIHRAVLRLLEARSFPEFLAALSGPVAETLRIDSVRLILETKQRGDDPALASLGEVLGIADPGFVADYMRRGHSGPVRAVVLRRIPATRLGVGLAAGLSGSTTIYGEAGLGDAGGWLRSEALMRLDLGPGRLPGMLAMASEDPDLFRPSQGTDLLGFFAGVFERTMRGFLG